MPHSLAVHHTPKLYQQTLLCVCVFFVFFYYNVYIYKKVKQISFYNVHNFNLRTHTHTHGRYFFTSLGRKIYAKKKINKNI